MSRARLGLRAFAVRWDGMPGTLATYAATSARRARLLAARTLEDVWGVPVGRALVELHVRRAPWYDLAAVSRGREGPCDRTS